MITERCVVLIYRIELHKVSTVVLTHLQTLTCPTALWNNQNNLFLGVF